LADDGRTMGFLLSVSTSIGEDGRWLLNVRVAILIKIVFSVLNSMRVFKCQLNLI